MRINSINNTQRNTSFNAKLTIVGDKALFTKEQVSSLTKKAEKLGGKNDMVLIGVTRCANRKPTPFIKAMDYESSNKENGSHTLLAGVCHSFFEVNNPPSFIKNIGDVYGTKEERAKKSFDIIEGLLDNIEKELKR